MCACMFGGVGAAHDFYQSLSGACDSRKIIFTRSTHLREKERGGRRKEVVKCEEKTFKVILFIYFIWMAYG